MSKVLRAGGTRIGIGGSVLTARRELPRVTVEDTEFRRLGVKFSPYGFHNLNFEDGAAVEQHWDDYYETQGASVQAAIRSEMRGNRAMGANVFRVQLQMFQYITGPDKDTLSVRTTQMDNLMYQVEQARLNDTYMILCGGNTGIMADTPAWYDDDLTYQERWDVQDFFWTSLVTAVVNSDNATTVLAYDLMNEPGITTDAGASWYLGNFKSQGIWYGQQIAKGAAVDNDTVRDWITQERDAIKAVDPDALVTIGAFPFHTGAFGYANTEDLLDFCSPHVYPPSSALGTNLATQLSYITGWTNASVPVINGEWLAWADDPDDSQAVLDSTVSNLQGAVSYAYGYPPSAFAPQPNPVIYPALGANDQWYTQEKDSLTMFLGYGPGDF